MAPRWALVRRLVASAIILVLAAAPAAAQAVLVIDRERMVTESAAAKALRQIEIDLRARVQSELDKVKDALEAEEKELTRLRDELPKEEFEARSRDFDRRVRIERRAAQERGAILQKFISDAQEELLRAAAPVLAQLRRDRGAAVLLDASVVVAGDPSIDVTDEAIARFDAALSDVTFTPPSGLGLE